jgi:cysteine desulfurase / selenocysteine lyase
MDLQKDFPIFTHKPGLVYLDNASTTQKPQFVIDVVSSFVSEKYANIHRWQYDLSAEVEDIYMQSKKMAAKLISCDMTEIIYHYNATACSNLIAQALCYSGKVGKWDTVILGLWDHHATIVVRQQLQKIFGFAIRYIPLSENDYRVDWDGFCCNDWSECESTCL